MVTVKPICVEGKTMTEYMNLQYLPQNSKCPFLCLVFPSLTSSKDAVLRSEPSLYPSHHHFLLLPCSPVGTLHTLGAHTHPSVPWSGSHSGLHTLWPWLQNNLMRCCELLPPLPHISPKWSWKNGCLTLMSAVHLAFLYFFLLKSGAY